MSDSAPTLDFALGETADAIRDTTQRFALESIAPLAAGVDAGHARAHVYEVAKACDAGRATRYAAAGEILLASENAVQVCLNAIRALGGAGYAKDYPVERLSRDAKLYDIGVGAREIGRFLFDHELVGAG